MLLILLVAAASAEAAVDFSVTNDWGSGFQAKVTIRNDGTQPITHWRLAFDFQPQIASIWNAEVAEHTATRYVVKHPAWSDSIAPGKSVEFGFIGTPGNVMALPSNFTVTGDQPVSPQPPAPTTPPTSGTGGSGSGTTGSRVTFAKTTDWGSGYNAEIIIYSPPASSLNSWKLEFDLPDTITSLWNGIVSQPVKGHYVVNNEHWNGTVPAGGSVSIGFGAGVSGSSHLPSGCKLNGVVCSFEGQTAGGGTGTGTGSGSSGSGGTTGGTSTGSQGSGTATVLIEGIDNPQGPVLAPQLTVTQGVTNLTVTVAGGQHQLIVATNNPAVATAVMTGSNTLQITGRAAGRASLRLTDTTTNSVRHVGVRVRNQNGTLPGFPDYVSIGSVSEDTPGDLELWRNFGSGQTNTRVDLRYIYLPGGPFNGWYTWGANGNRIVSFIRESKKLGMIPVFVYYNIPDSGESYYTDDQHIKSAEYMAAYFKDLKLALDLIRAEGGDDTVGIVLEPDFIGYLMQQSGRQPNEITAQVHQAYVAGVLDPAADPYFPDTVTGLVQAVNYLIAKRAPNAVFGWQFNLWGTLTSGSGIPATGLMRITDTLGIPAGRTRIKDEARKIADYYMAAGVLSHGAHFVSIDKYGLDGGFDGAAAPWNSTWFWNAIHWNNYLLFTKTLNERTGRPVVLWQIPVGHVNHSLALDPYVPGGVFPDLTNTYQRYEDSAPSHLLGDSFTTTNATRLQYFGTKDPDNPASVSVSGTTITWASHMTAARDAGVLAVLFGDGVGESTHGRGSPPPDGYWFISKVQSYYLNPIPRK